MQNEEVEEKVTMLEELIRIAVKREVMLQNTNTFNQLIEDIKYQIS